MGTTMPSSTCASKRGFVFKSLLFDRGVTSAVGHPSMEDFHEKTNVLAVKGWFPVEGQNQHNFSGLCPEPQGLKLLQCIRWLWSGSLKDVGFGIENSMRHLHNPTASDLTMWMPGIPTYAVLISAEIRQWRQSLQMISASPRGSDLKRGFTIISIKTYRLHLGWESVHFVYATPKNICLSQTHTHIYIIYIIYIDLHIYFSCS